jgi:TP901 family phage tail tape measure protein
MNSNLKLFIELIARTSGLKTGLDDSGRAVNHFDQGTRRALDGTGRAFNRFNQGARRALDDSGRAVNRFTQGAKREFSELKGAVGSVGGMLAGLGISVGAVKVAMDSAGLDKSLTQIGQTAGASSREVAMLRSDLFRMGRESGQSIDDLKGGFDALVQSGLTMKEATSTLDGVNVAMAVTGANAQALSGGLTVAAQAFQFDLAKPGQALELLDKMTVAGRLGNAELQNLSDIFARVGVNAKSAGMDFDKTLAFIEGLSKGERNPERLATLAESTLRVFNNLNYQGAAQKATGVQFFDEKGNRRESLEVVNDLRTKYQQLTTDKQRALFIQAAFGKADLDTIKGIKALMTGDLLPQIKQFSGTIGQAGGTLKRDFGEATRNLIDQTGMLKNDLRQAADGFVKPINETMGLFIQFLRDKKENGGLELDGKDMIVGGSAALLGTILAARYGSKGLRSVAGKMLSGGGSLAVGVAEGKALQAAAGVAPVFVTNWPGGASSSSPGGGSGPFNPTEWGGSPRTPTSSPVPNGSKAIPYLMAGGTVAAPALLTTAVATFSRWFGERQARQEASWRSSRDLMDLRARQMVMGGGPRSFQTQVIDAELARRWRDGLNKEIKNEIKIELNIDGSQRVMSATPGMNNRISVMKRGSFFDAMTTTAGMGY